MGEEHKCSKEPQIDELTRKVNKISDAIYGNSDSNPGLRIEVALLSRDVKQTLDTLTPMSRSMEEIHKFINGVKERDKYGSQLDNKRNRNTNTWVAIGALAVSAGSLLAMVLAFIR
jgi:hypothetical protein